ncbi:MAG: TfoX/Sxy family transcriptional regulator of competence genes [Planctomycetota bacterium]|jgi:TfoX/Sxy family transcriptional regulator of competence genes
MGTSNELVDRILVQLAPLDVRARAMFGGWCIYCDDKVVALVDDEQLFLKLTAASTAWQSKLESAPPYPGAKLCLVVSGRLLGDRSRWRDLVQATADALPKSKPPRSRMLQGKQAKK